MEATINGQDQPKHMGVIRYHGRLPIQPLPSAECPSAKYFYLHLEKLKQQIQDQNQELLETENEHNLLNQKVQELDVTVKQQDHEVACSTYELEQINKTKAELEAKLLNSSKIKTIPPLIALPIAPNVPEVVSIPVQVPSSSSAKKPDSPFHLDHSIDFQKEPHSVCICGVQFTTKQNLREHIKYYTSGMKFLCTVCGIRKHGLNQLRTHMKATHGISSAYLASVKGCRLCGQIFTSLQELHQHRRSKHERKHCDLGGVNSS